MNQKHGIHRVDVGAVALAAVVVMAGMAANATTLAEYAANHPLRLFKATRGAVMPNTTDQTNTLEEGDKALLLRARD